VTNTTNRIDRSLGNSRNVRLTWVDSIKAIALLWIIINHMSERLFGAPYFANPSVNWPSFAGQIAQLRPLQGYGVLDIPLNLFRYIGWDGDLGVQLFLLVSGFGLTWGLLHRHAVSSLNLKEFYLRRAERIYPLWWGAHILFVLTFLVSGWGIPLTESSLYLSMLGVRFTPGLLYYFAPAWWYFGLAIQLYIVYPLLWNCLRRFGPLKLLLVSCGIAFAARAVGLLVLGNYVDAWQRGAFFITQLPAFVFGMSLAAWLKQAPQTTDQRIRAPITLLLAIGMFIAGTVLSFTLLGMAVAPFVAGVALFVLMYSLLGGAEGSRPANRNGLLGWIGQHSLSLYLMHHPLILLLIPRGLTINNGLQVVVGTIAAILLTPIAAVLLERLVDRAMSTLRKWRADVGIGHVVLRIAFLGVVVAVLLIGSEVVVRQVAPQEILGWGERPSLEPDATFGWHLKPASQTHLRWASYDYTVTANKLGFPGPEYPETKTPQTFRILTTGDAFTSAEGVDTNEAWPRLLETNLAEEMPKQRVEVLNFAITGYGPNQYAAVIQAYAPVYKPDLILVEFFVNDYQDVLTSNEQLQKSIGFGQASQDSLYSIVRLMHLQRFVELEINGPLMEVLQGKPNPNGYFLGNFAAFERDQPKLEDARRLVAARLKLIKEVADGIGARVVIVMVPASVQVCDASQLAYYPRAVNLNDANRFAPDLPQRITEELASAAGFGYYDLRPVLRSDEGGCPYQPHNMHWLPIGHRVVATYLAQKLTSDNYISHGALS
jgi:peptidoglycan/LPS O-acetylase OafA/YrhL